MSRLSFIDEKFLGACKMFSYGYIYSQNMFCGKHYLEKTQVFKSKSDEKCSICCTPLKNNDLVRKIQCSHTFHIECIDRWTCEHNNCPNCRAEI